MKIEQPKTQARTLTYSESEALKREEQQLQDIKDGVELKQGVKYEAEDLASLDKKLAQIREIREKGTSPDLSDSERNYLEKRADMIKEHMHKINPTFNEFQSLRPSHGPRYSRLVQQLTKNMQDKEYQGMVRDWQESMRKLHPDDPWAADTRNLYKE